MLKHIKYLLFFLILSSPIFAEEMTCVPSCGPRPSPLAYAKQYSSTILVGSFIYSKESKKITSKAGIQWIHVSFKIKNVLKGRVDENHISMNIPVLSNTISSSQDDRLFKEWQSSLSSNDGSEASKKYNLFEMSLQSKVKEYASANFLMAHIVDGSIDRKAADYYVPLFLGQDYVVLLSNEYFNENTIIFPKNWYVYPSKIYK